MVLNYQQALDYLYANLPMFQRVGHAALKPDLSNTLRLCAFLDNPQDHFKTIHVAGTNGKGSTSHLLASILQSAGYKTGLYTSPHLKSFTERIRINGQEVDQDFVVDFVNRLMPTVENIKPSFFEITVVMAFEYFKQQGVEIAVVEVGLGGRLDSTNVIRPMLSIITNIGWDHSDLLGDTLEKIAYEKAGIIKEGIPVVISERQPAVEHVFINKSDHLNSRLLFASDLYSVRRDEVDSTISVTDADGKELLSKVTLPLGGDYQLKNVPGVVCAVDVLRGAGMSVSYEALASGINGVVEQTGLKGRWQKLAERPLIVCDTGHNADGMKLLVQQIMKQSFKTLRIVLGMVGDKDTSKVLNCLPDVAVYYFCQANIPRAMPAALLAEKAKEYGLSGVVVPDVNLALQKAKEDASENDFIFVGGSTFVVAEIDNL